MEKHWRKGKIIGALALLTIAANPCYISANQNNNALDYQAAEVSQAGNPNPGYETGGLEKIALSEERFALQENQTNYTTDDETLLERMNQPVRETLAGADYTEVNDENYQANVVEAGEPVMVLFYNDTSAGGGDPRSRGLAAFTKALHEQFPQIKFCKYEISATESVPLSRIEELQESYPLKTSPALLFYEAPGTSEQSEYATQVAGGPIEIENLKEALDYYKEAIPRHMLE